MNKPKMKRIIKFLIILILMLSICTLAFGEPPSHDPSTMIMDGSRYWIFTTGANVWCMSSSNTGFTDWRAETSPFAGGYPSWIKTYVSAFDGNFWAPDVVYRNNQFRLYYSCSTFGSQNSCIGLATASTLSGPWNDQGMVVYSNSTFQENAIDPAIFGDWLIYGSFFGGIRMAQLDINGKPINSTRYAVASGDAEAPYLLQNGSFYYLFINRGACCNGINSTTYRIQVGRSTNITGPYIDQAGRDLNSGGGTDFIVTSGRFIGPGHFGYGEGKLTYHFYDGYDNGNAKLMITTLGWSNGWPVAGGTSVTPVPSVTLTAVRTATRTATTGITATVGRTATRTITSSVTSTLSRTATRTLTGSPSRTTTTVPTGTTGTFCTPQAQVTIPFVMDGAGDFCWETALLGNYINSWNLDLLDINGVNYTNMWVSASVIPKVNNKYVIHYKTQVTWGHFEAK